MVAPALSRHFSWRVDPDSRALIQALKPVLGQASQAAVLRLALAALPPRLSTAQIQAVLDTGEDVGNDGQMTHIMLDPGEAAKLHDIHSRFRLPKAALMRYALRVLAQEAGLGAPA